MSLELAILPQYLQGRNFSHDVIRLSFEPELFEVIKSLVETVGRPIKEIDCYLAEDGYGSITEDPYGNPIKGVQARQLKQALDKVSSTNLPWRNKAFLAYLNELPDDLEVWFYWS
ncbi:hypothetical protein [Crocosphaera chwakensis]|uniref:Uncharacterized protein n=1 Tax=Crocosphaera chwakensis CCY0110 TaxID=391612 RepID=A3ITW5_9CHRO|nr:hypothetical protein [Crocosphaera chwakensis]EAZ90060.1 hypothetical protein CY0110_14980 [Crocosphaera chwakensis CCY0110]